VYVSRTPSDIDSAEVGAPVTQAGTNGYLFCFWNVENLFDDMEDPRLEGADREYDRWFYGHPAVLRQKLGNLASALVEMNGGRGPDMLALAEVESSRAVELLRLALNDQLVEPSDHYTYAAYKDPGGLRRIATGLIARVPIDSQKTRVLGGSRRTLETQLRINDRSLTVIVSHWTSRITDKTGDARGRYADQIYNVYRAAWRRDPNVDFLVCGDFNDSPTDPSVTERLHAIGDREAVVRARETPLFFNVSANRDPRDFGTHFHREPLIFDQIVVSPGLLDRAGWSCDPASLHVANHLTRRDDRQRRPWPFGSANDGHPRGYSDHFPVTLRLHVN
jgi:endonuclease/exonuclease/phosphatase family metal-dependent hydrolase